ncbi:MAG: hypothetical protein EHM28_03665 [Spirochaetaceae bacterium]|nr:MAG: hypothetical protein EHM28_03665 [Spirochaetaceae bacterium]
MNAAKLFLLSFAFLAVQIIHAQDVIQIKQEHIFFNARIDERDYKLEGMIYRPDDNAAHPVIIMNHGRNGKSPSVNPNEVSNYADLCKAFAQEGFTVLLLVRRGYGASQGPDSELKTTAVDSGLEGAKDVQAAILYMQQQSFVIPEKVVIAGQSQGGWVALACSAVRIRGVLGAINISGGTNYASMGPAANSVKETPRLCYGYIRRMTGTTPRSGSRPCSSDSPNQGASVHC